MSPKPNAAELDAAAPGASGPHRTRLDVTRRLEAAPPSRSVGGIHSTWNERRHLGASIAVVRQRRTTGTKSGTAPSVSVSVAPAPPARDLVVVQIRADLELRQLG